MSAAIKLEDLRILLNATFMVSKKPIDDTSVHSLVNAAQENIQEGTKPILRVLRETDDRTGFKTTASVFYSERNANFVAEQDLTDLIASYVVIIEVDEHRAAVFKKGGASLKAAIDKHFDIVGYDSLLATFDDSRTEIQKLSAREMNISDKGMRSRSYEAPDLKGHMSPHAAGGSIPKFTRIRTRNEVASLGLTTGRINQLTDRTTVRNAAQWVAEKFALMERKRKDNSFFSSFAQRVELSEAIKEANPASILFERAAIEEDINENDIPVFYVDRNRVERKMKPETLKRFLRLLDRAYEIDPSTHRFVGTRLGKLRVNKRTLSPSSRGMQRIKLGGGKSQQTLQHWITMSGYFTVTFDRPEYIYVDRHCFMDRAGKSEVQSVLKCLEVKKDLGKATTEKGVTSRQSTCFPDDSLFSVVEKIHCRETYVFCDDFGDEWADHICIDMSSARVTFIHSKHAKRKSNSASAMHEVVGQAIKNLGNMHFTSQTFQKKKLEKFKNTYASTSIRRTRRGNVANVMSDVKALLADHRLHRKVVIACPYLSKSSVGAEFVRMGKGYQVRGNVTQLFWIISSYIHAAMGAAVVPVIYCDR